jgi:hypothetical protein
MFTRNQPYLQPNALFCIERERRAAGDLVPLPTPLAATSNVAFWHCNKLFPIRAKHTKRIQYTFPSEYYLGQQGQIFIYVNI